MIVKNLSNEMKLANIRNGMGTLAVEGVKPSKEAKKINNCFLNGEISSGEAIERIKNLYGGDRND